MVYNKCVHSGPLNFKSDLELSLWVCKVGSGEVTVALWWTSFNLSLYRRRYLHSLLYWPPLHPSLSLPFQLPIVFLYLPDGSNQWTRREEQTRQVKLKGIGKILFSLLLLSLQAGEIPLDKFWEIKLFHVTEHSTTSANGACDPVVGVEWCFLLFLRVTFSKALEHVTVSSFFLLNTENSQWWLILPY